MLPSRPVEDASSCQAYTPPPPDCASTHTAAEVYQRPIAVRLVGPQQAPIPASRPSPVAHRRFLLRGGAPSCNLSFLRRLCCNKR
ncbi:hypothetical protein HN873_029129 [Arachis hypogaea]